MAALDPIEQGISLFAGKGPIFDYVLLILFVVFCVFFIMNFFGIFNPVSKKLMELGDIAKEQLRITKEGYLKHPEQTDIVKDFGYGRVENLKMLVVKYLLDIYIDDKISEDDVERIMSDKFQMAINEVDGQLNKLPNVQKNAMTKEKKLQAFMAYKNSFLTIMEEKNLPIVKKQITGLVDTIITNNEF